MFECDLRREPFFFFSFLSSRGFISPFPLLRNTRLAVFHDGLKFRCGQICAFLLLISFPVSPPPFFSPEHMNIFLWFLNSPIKSCSKSAPEFSICRSDSENSPNSNSAQGYLSGELSKKIINGFHIIS